MLVQLKQKQTWSGKISKDRSILFMSGMFCPLQQAISEALELEDCFVGINFWWFSLGDMRPLPDEVKSIIRDWDDHKPIEPMDFWL